MTWVRALPGAIRRPAGELVRHTRSGSASSGRSARTTGGLAASAPSAAAAASSSPRGRSTTSATSGSARDTMVGPYACPDGRDGPGTGDGDGSGGAHRGPLRHRPGQPHRRATGASRSATTSRPAPTSTSPTRTTPTATPTIPIGRQWPVEAAVRIGSGSWLGAHCVVLPGADLGNTSVVAAGAVVRGRVPDHCVVAGVPARIVRRFDPDEGWVPSRDEVGAEPERPGGPGRNGLRRGDRPRSGRPGRRAPPAPRRGGRGGRGAAGARPWSAAASAGSWRRPAGARPGPEA